MFKPLLTNYFDDNSERAITLTQTFRFKISHKHMLKYGYKKQNKA